MRTSRVFIAAGLITLLVVSTMGATGCGKERERPSADPASRRATASGAVVGFVGAYGSHEWRGIPFAAPPVGALRWRAPLPAESWTGTREALAFGSACTQYASPLGGVKAREGTP